MPQVETEICEIDRQLEEDRLAALISTEILDTPPESTYDTITRLAGEYFQADSAGLGFADESRVWMKSCWRQTVRELPRQGSIFDLVLAEDGPVVVADISDAPAQRVALATLQASGRGFLCQRSRALHRGQDSRHFDRLP